MPVEHAEWNMTPQTVNASYAAVRNEIVFPAAILQPPLFDASADDAVNYGAIGAVIGHEISHGFDDEGSQSDGDGNLRDWWSVEDRARFNTKAAALVAQYGAYSPLAGYRVNGELTLGENIADNAGLLIAYKAYQLSLDGQPAPVMDGWSGAQRFYLGFARLWRRKDRDAHALNQLNTDPHAPAQFRTNGTLRNQDGFHAAFDVKQGDPMYLAPSARINLW
jgi:predicted metalloendopeptidase